MVGEGPFKDFEQFFEEPDVKKEFDTLKRQVSSLRRNTAALTKRLSDLEVMGFQDQLNSVNTTLGNIGAWLLYIRRELANNSIRLEMLWMSQYLSDEGIRQARANDANFCIQSIRVLATELLSSLTASTEPENVSAQMRIRSKPVLVRRGFGDYFPP